MIRSVIPWAPLLFDRLAAAVGLIVLSPLLALICAVIALEDGFPVLFRQTRIGKSGRQFRLVKFRSMRAGLAGNRITSAGDPRLTRAGAWLRRYKIDELPQLWNVLTGEMSLVGPRPEVPAFVDLDDATWRSVLRIGPGITDLASLVFRNEESILAGNSDPERYYREVILPAKLSLNLEYMRARSFRLDLKLILLTVRLSFIPSNLDSNRLKKMFLNQEIP